MTNTNTFEYNGINIGQKYRSNLEDFYFATVTQNGETGNKATLTNKITFSALWKHYFGYTEKATFLTTNGESKDVTMMWLRDIKKELCGMSDSLCSAVRLPYDGQFSMVAILPAKESSIKTLLSTLSVERLKQIQSSLQHYDKITVAMPAFTTKVKTDLMESLTNLGCRKMSISGEADFSRMNDNISPTIICG